MIAERSYWILPFIKMLMITFEMAAEVVVVAMDEERPAINSYEPGSLYSGISSFMVYSGSTYYALES